MNGSTEKVIIIKAPWVLSSGGRWLQNASVVLDVAQGVVLDVQTGKPCIVAGHRVFDVGSKAIIPGLVNAHTHLELSMLSGIFREILPGDYVGWVRKVMSQRMLLSEEDMQKAFVESALRCFREGTAFVGDVSNKPLLELSEDVQGSNLPVRHLFWEWIGFTVEAADFPEESKVFREKAWASQMSIVPHAVYSTSPFLIQKSKEWCRERNRVFSIHIGETEEEVRFLREGKGLWRDFLEELGKWNDYWIPPGTTPVKYLDSLGVLDSCTLLVHCLHLNSDDWDEVKARQCYVCLCPRSNKELGTGSLPAQEILRRNIPFLLGTDSLASSPSLNMFEEAVFLLEHYPDFSPEAVLKAITGEGNRFFTQSDACFVEAGFRRKLLAVEVSERATQKDLSSEILYNGVRGAYTWITEN
jgi:cytosine/adenosine deaminase-related metal-dependent hydrolase